MRRTTRGLALAAAAGLLVAAPLAGQASYEELQTFSGVLNHIRLNYVDSTTYHELVQAAIRGVLRALDPHSSFFSSADWEKLSKLDKGELAGPGLQVETVDSAVTVVWVVPKSPAAKAGILPGDRVTRVNDTTVAGLSERDVNLRLGGDQGSKVRLTLERGPRLEPDTFTVDVKRDFFTRHLVSITRMADSITGYVRLEEFGETAAPELHDALKKLKGQGARQVILDLRGNPGGLVYQAVDVAAEFFPKNTVVFQSRGRKRELDTTFTTKKDGDFTKFPLVVLIDGLTASAAEALSGSLQDHDRALIVGRRSFGKALMQVDFVVLPGDDILHLTVGYILSPSGRYIQRRYHGIGVEQYRSFAGKSGTEEDTNTVYHTDDGRPVRGGGGIAPDLEVGRNTDFPVWWSAAVDSGLNTAVVDSVALTLPATPAGRAAWISGRDQWEPKLLPPFLARVRSRFKIPAQTDSALAFQLAATLARETAGVRWGDDAADEFLLKNSADVRTALGAFPRLAQLLSGPGK
ncbi:MAG TPA: S41 family peptidase [Gemmatimonadales bacterium]|nr:S41 family peptidase [Gemmatimonadales bacterium]